MGDAAVCDTGKVISTLKTCLAGTHAGYNTHRAGDSMTVTRTINGKPVADEEIKEYIITNKHVIGVLYDARRRAEKEHRRH